MKHAYPEIKANFIIDEKGKKKSVILDIKQFNDLLETLQDYYEIAHAALEKDPDLENAISLEDLKKQILKNTH
jgi:hypothetical protein